MIVAAFAALLSACASAPEAAPSGPPNVLAGPGEPAPAQARLYVNCINQAADAGRFDREGGTIRFHCEGAPAEAFFNGLAAWSAAQHSEIDAEGRITRFSVAIERDASGVDHCWRTKTAPAAYGCIVVLNVGPFLTQ